MFLVADDTPESGKPGLRQQSDRSGGWERLDDVAKAWLARIRPFVTNADEAYENGKIHPPKDAGVEIRGKVRRG